MVVVHYNKNGLSSLAFIYPRLDWNEIDKTPSNTVCILRGRAQYRGENLV